MSLALVAVVTVACGGSPAAPPKITGRSMPAVTAGPDGTVHVVAVGDIACAPGQPATPLTCQQEATARLTESLDPDVVVALGDLQYETGSATDFQDSFRDSWGSLGSVTRAVPGNHEYKTEDAAGYFASVDTPGPWYVWDAGEWRLYMLNSNCEDVDCAAEQDWLRADLADHPRRCTAIAMHHPRYSSGPHHSDETMSGFWRIAYDRHVDLALAAHDHDYERFAPMDAEGTVRPGRGITSFVSGTGGKSLYLQGSAVEGSAYFQASRFGVLELTLAPEDFSWKFVSTDGTMLDQGWAPCV
jgi:hypothetical protein